MKLTLHVILFCVCFTHIYGQERINRDRLNFEQKSEILTNASGWSFNQLSGKWIETENMISDNVNSRDRTIQNFRSIQTKSLTYKGSKYYVIIVEKLSGEYRYPVLHLEWIQYINYEGYIFTEKEYGKLFNIKGVMKLKTRLMSRHCLEFSKYNEEDFLDGILFELRNKKDIFGSYVYIFPVMKSEDGKIRFYVPDNFINFEVCDFSKRYFETDYENFSKILLK